MTMSESVTSTSGMERLIGGNFGIGAMGASVVAASTGNRVTTVPVLGGREMDAGPSERAPGSRTIGVPKGLCGLWGPLAGGNPGGFGEPPAVLVSSAMPIKSLLHLATTQCFYPVHAPLPSLEWTLRDHYQRVASARLTAVHLNDKSLRRRLRLLRNQVLPFHCPNQRQKWYFLCQWQAPHVR